MKKRILIEENKAKYIEIVKDLKQFMPVLNELKASFEALEIGEFTNDDFKRIILVGPTNYIEIYVKNLNNQLDKAGITIQIVRQNAIKNHEFVIERFKKAVENAKRFSPEIYSANRPKLPLKLISFEDGLFVISKEDKEMILETFCRIYLENEEEIKLYEISQNLANALTKYFEALSLSGIPSFDKQNSIKYLLKFDNETNRMIVNPEGVKAVASYKKRKEEYSSIGVK